MYHYIDASKRSDAKSKEKRNAEAARLIAAVPLLRELESAGVISATCDQNSMYAYRGREAQRSIAEIHGHPKWPSGCIKFRNLKDSKPEKYENVFNYFHGNISGKEIKSICTKGLKPYPQTCGHRIEGHTLVTPSWVLALEGYGYECDLGEGLIRVCLKVQVPRTEKGVSDFGGKPLPNTFYHAYNSQEMVSLSDWNVKHSEMEISVPVETTQVVAVIVKQYHRENIIKKLRHFNGHPHRLGHTSSFLHLFHLRNHTDDFYTTDSNEKDNLLNHPDKKFAQLGYKDRGILCRILLQKRRKSDKKDKLETGPLCVPGAVPLYRYCNAAGNHFYTINEAEIGTTTLGATGRLGYKCEKIEGYVLPHQTGYTRPLHRYRLGGNHFYTTEILKNKPVNVVAEGIACWVY